MKEWDEVTGINPAFNKRKHPEPKPPGTQLGAAELDAATLRAEMERGAGCICEKCQAYRHARRVREEPKRVAREREKLESSTEQARIDQARVRYGWGRER